MVKIPRATIADSKVSKLFHTVSVSHHVLGFNSAEMSSQSGRNSSPKRGRRSTDISSTGRGRRRFATVIDTGADLDNPGAGGAGLGGKTCLADPVLCQNSAFLK